MFIVYLHTLMFMLMANPHNFDFIFPLSGHLQLKTLAL